MSNLASSFGSAEFVQDRVAKPSFLSRMLSRMIAGREAQARREIAHYIGRLSDQQLMDLGFNAEQVRQVRDTGRIPASFWC